MRQELDIASQQLDALSNYLAFVPRDPSLSLSAQIARDAAAGDVWARRVMHSRALECPQTVEAVEPAEYCAPLPSVAVAAQPPAVLKQARDAAYGVMTGMHARGRRRTSVGTVARRAAHGAPRITQGRHAELAPTYFSKSAK